MYLSTSMFDNAVIFRGSFQSLRVEYRHTHAAYSYFGRRRIRLMFFCEHILEICRSWLLATGQQYCFGTTMEVFLQNTDNNPEQNTNVDPPPGLPPQQNNNQDDDNPPEPFNTPPSSPHLPDVPITDDPNTPNPGFPPDDDPFHTPFHSPPRPSDDTPDDEMHPSPDESPDLPPHPSSPPDHFLEPLAFLLLQIPLLCPIRLYRQILRTHQWHTVQNDHLVIHRYHLQLRLDHLDKCLLRLQPNFSLVTFWGVIHSHESHQTRPHNPL